MIRGTAEVPAMRQTLLSFYSTNRRFVKIVFTHEQQIHDPEIGDDDKSDEVSINALVLLSVTEKYDREIYEQMHSNGNIQVIMPFGSSQTFQDIVQWLVYGDEPVDFVCYQLCAEFARFYEISLPYHPDAEIVNRKLDDMEFPPPAAEPLEDLDDDWRESFEEIVHWQGRLYKRRSIKTQQHGCYYYCMNVVDQIKCKGSIFVSDTGEIRAVNEHRQECGETDLVTLDLSCWDKAERELREIAYSSPDISSWHVLKTLLEKHEDLAHCVLQLPLHVVLRYITRLTTKPSECLDARIEKYCHIARESILYQEVYPDDWIIYSHPEVRKRVKAVRWLLIDGTFKACPSRFGQLLTLLSRDDATSVFFPVIRALMPSRTAKSYLRLFEIIDSYFSFPRLAYVTVDFEKSLVQVVQSWVKGRNKPVEIIGCKFHYAKAVTYRFKGGKKRKLKTQDRAILKAFQSMPFLEQRDIKRMLSEFQTVVHSHVKFAEYFQRTWMSNAFFPLWNLSNKQHHGLRTRYTNNGIESFHSRIGSELSRHPQTQNLLKWFNDYSEEKLREIQTTTGVGQEIDTTTCLNRLEILFEWRKTIESFETRPEFRVLPFSYVCPACGAINQLEGRRQSHLTCQAKCGHDLDGPYIDNIIGQIRHSLEASFQQAKEEDEPKAICTLKRLRYWFKTLDDGTLQTHDATYIKEMRRFIKTLIPHQTLTHAVMHPSADQLIYPREYKGPKEGQRRGRPNRIARMVIQVGHAVYPE